MIYHTTSFGPMSKAGFTVLAPLFATICNTEECFSNASASHLQDRFTLMWSCIQRADNDSIENNNHLWRYNIHLISASCTASCCRALLLYKAIRLTRRDSSNICKRTTPSHYLSSGFELLHQILCKTISSDWLHVTLLHTPILREAIV